MRNISYVTSKYAWVWHDECSPSDILCVQQYCTNAPYCMYTETHHHLLPTHISHMYLSADEWMVLLKHLEVFLGGPHTLLQYCMDLGYIQTCKEVIYSMYVDTRASTCTWHTFQVFANCKVWSVANAGGENGLQLTVGCSPVRYVHVPNLAHFGNHFLPILAYSGMPILESIQNWQKQHPCSVGDWCAISTNYGTFPINPKLETAPLFYRWLMCHFCWEWNKK